MGCCHLIPKHGHGKMGLNYSCISPILGERMFRKVSSLLKLAYDKWKSFHEINIKLVWSKVWHKDNAKKVSHVLCGPYEIE